MSFIPQDSLDEIRERSSIVSVISQYVNLKKAGVNYKGPCPFHAEKTPSFIVSEAKKIYHCFGCGKGGNIFTFLMEHVGLSFPEAIERLAGELGISLEKYQKQTSQQTHPSKREHYFRINRAAMLFYEKQLQKNTKAQKFLNDRGLTPKMIRDYHLGFAPEGWRNLLEFFKKKGVLQKDLLDLGLVVQKENSKTTYDRFRNRIIFPLLDLANHVLGFGGRVIHDQDQPKYLNSSESEIYNKRRHLYGLSQGLSQITKEGVILVEGYFDCLLPHQFGFKNCVATMGTALSIEHLQTLKKYTDQFFVLFDQDEAGYMASERSLSLFLECGISAKIIELPHRGQKPQDPDEFLLDKGKAAFAVLQKKARPLLEFMMDRKIRAMDRSASGKAKVVESITPFISNLPSAIEKEEMVKKLADKLGVQEKWVYAALGSKSLKHADVPKKWQADFVADKNPIELEVIEFFMLFPEWVALAEAQNLLDLFTDPELKEVALNIAKTYQVYEKIDFSSILGKIENSYLVSRLRQGVLDKEMQNQTKDEWFQVYEACTRRLWKNHLEQKEKQLLKEIQNLDQTSEEETKKMNLLTEYQNIVRQKQEY
ncbi:MAG: DNA primase [Deltaproteobacteria bacterium RIFCSPHIGHO2_02_FULL_40_11]|nr:MAG: DNA primase [Deltaproteobacteria bacterium RIFCSPHIGHO2_02_FULL_40_11]